VLYCEEVVDGQLEQVEGVSFSYSLEKFVEPNLPVEKSQTNNSLDNYPTSQNHSSLSGTRIKNSTML